MPKKNIESDLRVYLSGCFLIAQAGFFICCTTTVGLYWGIIILLKFHVQSRYFFLQSFAKFQKINHVKKKHYFAIFLPNSIATRMPYLPAKDELVSLDRLSSRGLWKWYNSEGFGPATIWRGAAFHFLENENSFETLIVIFENVSPKGSFWLKMKYFEISVLTANCRYLQTAAL